MSQYQTMSGSRVLAAYLGDIRFELVKMCRTPQFAVPTMLFPIMFYLLFGVALGSARGNSQQALFAFSSFGVLAAMGPGLFGFGVSLAFEREQGLLVYRQAIPMPAGSNLLARMVMAMIFTAIVTIALLALAIVVSHVSLTPVQCLLVFVVNVFGALPFCALGMFFGALISGQAAPAILNVIFIAMSFLAGLFVPMQMLPASLQKIAPVWPTYHLVQLSREVVGIGSTGSTANHLAALAGFAILFFGLAMRMLSGRGFRVFGASRGRGFPLRRAVNIGLFWVGVGLVIAGVMGGNSPRAAAGNAVASTDAKDANASGSGVPAGLTAPNVPVIADFDNGSEKTSYGLGFSASDDKMRGGNSSVSQKLVDKALEVTGEVGNAIPYPFAGTSFLPNGTPKTEWLKQGFMDYSHKQALRFRVRGDGHSYMVMMMGPTVDAIPAMFSFEAGPEWHEVRVPLSDMGAVDLQRVKLISFGTMSPGTFRFQIDDVRVE